MGLPALIRLIKCGPRKRHKFSTSQGVIITMFTAPRHRRGFLATAVITSVSLWGSATVATHVTSTHQLQTPRHSSKSLSSHIPFATACDSFDMHFNACIKGMGNGLPKKLFANIFRYIFRENGCLDKRRWNMLIIQCALI
jgi:hypothetical protein